MKLILKVVIFISFLILIGRGGYADLGLSNTAHFIGTLKIFFIIIGCLAGLFMIHVKELHRREQREKDTAVLEAWIRSFQ